MKKTSFNTLRMAVLLELCSDKKVSTDSIYKISTEREFLEGCKQLEVTSDYVIDIATKLKSILILRGYDFLESCTKEEDDFLSLVSKYFESTGYKALKLRREERISITALGMCSERSYIPVPTVVTYCCDDGFRSWIDTGALQPSPSPTI